MDEYMSAVKLFACKFVPKGWLPCDGRLLPIHGNEYLMALLGSVYGGDGMTTFALPYLPPVTTADGAQMQYCIGVEGLYPIQP